ncbi:carbohydrate-binding protein [Rhizobium sp. BR 315]|uniref:carbohydrate-binding protein n=1 Tax=Rhizobium sp. BR 315 TaxID=3040014 RepID=UPI003D342432
MPSRQETSTDQSFQSPGSQFRPAAYWFWHSIPSGEVTRRQLADFVAKGFGRIYIQARLAMPREDYLSEPFIAAYRDAVEVARTLSLRIGIYDDYNWISGQSAGRTVKGRDELRERHLFWCETSREAGEISGIVTSWTSGMGKDILDWQYDEGRPAWCDWTIEAVALHPAGDMALADEASPFSGPVEITGSSDEHCAFRISGDIPAGFKVTVFISARSRTSRIINYLLPEAAEAFITHGLEPLVSALDGFLPYPVDQIFYDQPAAGFYSWGQKTGNLENSLPFSATFARSLAGQTGQPLAIALLSLVRDIGPETPVIRAKTYGALSQQMNDAFFGTLRTWAEKNQLLLTGHEILPHVGSFDLNGTFKGIDPRIAPAVDFFGIDAYRHLTAADANNFIPQLSPKLADSVARANGRSRCMLETYATSERTPLRAAGQWELTLETLRTHLIRMHFLGMRQSIWHGLYMSDGTAEPRPFVNPRFDFAPGINFEPWWPFHELLADETARLSAFIEPARPLTRVAIFYPLHTALAEGPRHEHADHVGAWCRTLLERRIDFLFVSEDAVAEAAIGGSLITISGQTFDAVILPAVTTIGGLEAIHALERFAVAGGIVWSSGGSDHFVPLDGEGAIDNPSSKSLARLPTSDDVEALQSAFSQRGPVLRTDAEHRFWRWLGEDAAGWRLALFNDSAEPATDDFALSSGFDIALWDCADGTETQHGASSRLSIRLEPYELICLRLSPALTAASRLALPRSVPDRTGNEGIVLADQWTLRFEDSPRPIDIRVDCGWDAQGFETISGTATYSRMITTSRVDRWLLELPVVHTAASVSVGGRPSGRRGWRPYRFDLGVLGPGNHLLEISVSSTAANAYYADTPFKGGKDDPAGLGAPPILFFSGR